MDENRIPSDMRDKQCIISTEWRKRRLFLTQMSSALDNEDRGGTMSSIEQKLDAVIRCVLSGTEGEREQARGELCSLMTAKVPDQAETEWIVHNTLAELGVPSNLRGHDYLVAAICIAITRPDAVHSITGDLYPAVAKAYHTSAANVERAIRHAIENAFLNGDMEVLERYFGNAVSSERAKTTNGAFISRVANILRISRGVS